MYIEMTGTIYEDNARIESILNPIQLNIICCICENLVQIGKYHEIRVNDNMIYKSKYLCFKCKDFLRGWLSKNEDQD